ncbi:unnamed protein product [Urochloa humidicola]
MATGIDLIVLDSSAPPVADLDLGIGSFDDYSVHRVFLDPGGKHYITPVVHPGSELLLQIDPRASSIEPREMHLLYLFISEFLKSRCV